MADEAGFEPTVGMTPTAIFKIAAMTILPLIRKHFRDVTKMVGAAGIEPAATGSQSRSATAAPRPEQLSNS